MVPETNTVDLLVKHMRSKHKEVKIPAMHAISLIFFTENPEVIDYAIKKGLLIVLCQMSIEFEGTDEV